MRKKLVRSLIIMVAGVLLCFAINTDVNAIDISVLYDKGLLSDNQVVMNFELLGGTFKSGAIGYDEDVTVDNGYETLYFSYYNNYYGDFFIMVPQSMKDQVKGERVYLPDINPPTGYSFDGWYCEFTDEIYSGGATFEIPTDATREMDFVAKYSYEFDTEDGNSYSYFIKDGEATIVGIAMLNNADMVMPTKIGEYFVKSIKFDTTTKENEKICSVKLPEKITTIDICAFYGCSNLKSVLIPNQVETIDAAAFALCYSLNSITIPNSVTYIGDSAFENCFSLTDVLIGENVITIGDDAFRGCVKLNSIMLPDSVIYLGNRAFLNCTRLTKVILSKKIKKIGSDTFGFCFNLESINIPTGITEIKDRAFTNCISLEKIIITKSVTNIDDKAFSNCINLDDIYIYGAESVINENAFGYSSSRLYDGIGKDELIDWLNCDNADCGIEGVSNGDILLACYNSDDISNDIQYRVYLEYCSNYVTELEEYELLNNTLIHCYRESTAKDYAVANNIDYECFDHLHIETVTKEATCLEKGEKICTCECGDTYTEEIDILSHKFTDYISDNNANCISDGTKTAYCDNACGISDVITDENTMTPDIHTFTEWEETDDGEVRSCMICGYKETKIPTDDGDIEIVAPDNPDDDFDVDEKEEGDSEYILVEESLDKNHEGDYEILKLFDINLKNKDGVHVQPNGTVKVKLPLDWEKDGNYKVYRVNKDGTLTDMNAYRQGSHMVFETDHFSLYVIVDVSEKEAEENRTDECFCRCHSNNFFAKLIWKITIFFNKLFKKNAVCTCGVAHY